MAEHPLAQLMAERIVSGLKRKSLTTCSRWAEACRVMGGDSFPGPWRFTHHPWLKDMHDSESERIVGQKSAQMGYTEFALNTTFFNIDVKGRNCLYVLPALHPDASDFSASRFDPALELSSHLAKLFSDVKNVGHKRAGSANLYIRGSRSRSGLKSVPVSLIVLDEVDEMDQDNIPLALERTSGQIVRQELFISTPTITNVGINKYFMASTQEHYNFRCPHCNEFIEFSFPESLIITAEEITDPNLVNSYLICTKCKGRLEQEEKTNFLKGGLWVSQFPNRAITSRGFHINQLYSCAIKPWKIAESYLKALKDPADEQEFYNSKLGVPHVVAGAAITDENIDECRTIESIKNKVQHPNGIVTIGVDVGKWLHYTIDHWLVPDLRGSTDINIVSVPRTIAFGKVLHFEELDQLLREFGVNACVIDANPERRKAYEFACRFWGHVKLCLYGRGISGKQIHVVKEKSSDAVDEHTITVDRTSWLDLSLGRYKRRAIHIPIDIDTEYREHLKALVRIYERDKDNNPTGRYVNGADADHYAHARNYSEIALLFALQFGAPQDMRESVI